MRPSEVAFIWDYGPGPICGGEDLEKPGPSLRKMRQRKREEAKQSVVMTEDSMREQTNRNPDQVLGPRSASS